MNSLAYSVDLLPKPLPPLMQGRLLESSEEEKTEDSRGGVQVSGQDFVSMT